MLTIFQISVDLENSQSLGPVGGFDSRLFSRPGNAESIANRSWPSTLSVSNPDCPRANFFYVHQFFLLMDALAASKCRPALDKCGEMLEFDAVDIGPVYLFNTLQTLSTNAVDWSVTKGRGGVYFNLSLFRNCIPTQPSVFRIEKIGGIFLSTALQEDDEDFYHLYHVGKLSGLFFKRLWDEQFGPVPNRSTAPGMGT